MNRCPALRPAAEAGLLPPYDSRRAFGRGLRALRRGLRALGLGLALCLGLAGALAAQGQAEPFVLVHEFGGAAAGEPGFRVRFDLRGAAVLSVDLLDHDAPRLRGDEEPEPYRIVREELADPADPARGRYTWLALREDVPSAAFGTVGAGLDQAVWEVVEAVPGRTIRFGIDGAPGFRLEKTYAYDGEGRRDLRVEFAVQAAAGAEVGAIASGLRFELWGIALTSPRSDYVLGSNPSLAVGLSRTVEDETVLQALPSDNTPNIQAVDLASGAGGTTIDFAGNTNRFFGTFLYPIDEAGRAALLRADLMKVPQVGQDDTPAFSVPIARYALRLPAPVAGGTSTAAFRLYLGPKSFRVFDERPEYERFDAVLEQSLDPMCFCSIPGARTTAIFLLWLLGKLYDLVGNWGIAIVCLTILVRGSLVPLNFRAQKAMRAYGAKMAKVKPKLDAIQTRYKNDPEVLRAKMMEFQREHKLIPPLGGCLPLFVTFPVFIGLFTALRVAYELRQQSFVGWIDDLSRPDQLFEIGLGFLPWFNLLPIIMVAMWLWLQSSMPLPTDPQQRQMMKIMRFMPFMFAIFLYNYASGLMVYMITSSVFGLVEQRVTRRILGPVDPNAAGMNMTPMI
jgi:YidC/Oxa1 family membrane protein insertase